MPGFKISDDFIMRYVDGELPWSVRIPFRAALLLFPRLRQRVGDWRGFSALVRELGAGFATSSLRRRPSRT